MKAHSAALACLALPGLAADGKAPPKITSTLGTAKTIVPAKLKPGGYVWHPEVSPQGPVVLVVSLPEQQAYVYRNGVLIGASTVSTGKGHETPTGVFTILQKHEADRAVTPPAHRPASCPSRATSPDSRRRRRKAPSPSS